MANVNVQQLAGQIAQMVFGRLRDIESAMLLEATREAAAYVLEKMPTAKVCRPGKFPKSGGRYELLEHCLDTLPLADGLVLEFGVHEGESLQFIANRVDTYVYGFDSFEGLPEDRPPLRRRGMFSRGGEQPLVTGNNLNARLVK